MSRHPGAPAPVFLSLISRHAGHLLRGFAALLLLAGIRVQAQVAHFSWAQRAVGSSLVNPSGVAVGGNGTVFIIANGGGGYQVYQETPAPTGFVQTTPISTSGTAAAVAADGMGNLFIYDSTSQTVLEDVVGTNSQLPAVTAVVGLTGLAADSVGNLVFAIPGGVFQARMSTGMTGPMPGQYAAATQLPSDPGTPKDVAVDLSGNVYFSLQPTGATTYSIYKIAWLPLVGGYDSSATAIATGLNMPAGLAADGGGNVYFADPAAGTVSKLAATGATYSYAAPAVVATGLGTLHGIAADAAGDLFLTYGSTGVPAGALEILARTDFGPMAVGSAAPAMTLVFTFDRSTSLAPQAATLTQGEANRDFLDAGTGTLAVNGSGHTYSTGDTASVDVTFTPGRPGSRYGAVSLRDAGSGQVLASTYLQGYGMGPQAAFQPAAQTARVSSHAPSAVAADGNGNVYVATSSNGSASLVKVAPGGASSTLLTNLAFDITGLAVDGAGNLYVVDHSGRAVYKEALTGAGYAQTSVASGLSGPMGVAVDGGGNVFVSDSGSGQVFKETLGTSGYSQTTVDSGLNLPAGLALDVLGSLYVFESGTGRVLLETPNPSGTYARSVAVATTGLVNGLSGPRGLALDSFGNLYLADSGNNQVVKESLASGGGYSQSTLAQDGVNLLGVQDVAVDGAGNVFAAAPSANQVREFAFADPPSLSFPDTPVGSTSAKQTVTVSNTGNTVLTFPVPATGTTNPSVPTGFVVDSSSTLPQVTTTPFTLNPGDSRDLAIAFSPSAGGTASGSLVLTDDHLNAASPGYATQSIALTGNGTTQQVATVTIDPASLSQTYNTNPLPVTVTTSPANVPVTVTYSSSTYASSTTAPTNAGQYTVQATIADPNYQGTPVTHDLNIAKAEAVIHLIIPSQIITGSSLAAAATTIPAGLKTIITYDGNTSVPTTSGSHAVKAEIDDVNYWGSATGNLVIVDPPPPPVPPAPVYHLTRTFLTTTGGTQAGEACTLVATVHSDTAPSGTVYFHDGSTVLGSIKISGPPPAGGTSNTATLVTAPLDAGPHGFKASFLGDAWFLGSETDAQKVQVAPSLLFTNASDSFGNASSDEPQSRTVVPGGSATYPFTVQPTNAPLTAPVVFSSLGLPTGATATLSPQTITSCSTPIDIRLSIHVNQSTADLAAGLRLPGTGAGTFMVCGLLVIPLFRKRRRGIKLLAGLAMFLAVSVMGCYSSGKPGKITTYPLTVTAKANGVVVGSTTVNLQVLTPAP